MYLGNKADNEEEKDKWSMKLEEVMESFDFEKTLLCESNFELFSSNVANCDAPAVCRQQRATAAISLHYSVSSFSPFLFCVFVTLKVLFLFSGALIYMLKI